MTKAVFGLVLAVISFLSIYQASKSQSYGTFFAMRDVYTSTEASSGDNQNIIDESFHKCSNAKSCCKVAENIKTNEYKIVAVGQELPFLKRESRIWHKGILHASIMKFADLLFVDNRSFILPHNCYDFVPHVLALFASSPSSASQLLW